VHLTVNRESPCIFTRGIERIDLPVRHAEGKFYAQKTVLDRLAENNQIALQYGMPDGTIANGQFPCNPNGSLMDIAGICDPTGRIFGLMPHPEAFNSFLNHPHWTRKKELAVRSGKSLNFDNGEGLQIFQNAVTYIRTEWC
jgi:phosphoribosylformylglycinamidine synthase subunit PurQ / glutaminase